MSARSAEALEGFYAALRDDDAEQLYDRAPCGYLSTTPDGLVVKVNGTFLTLTGYRREDLVGVRRFDQLLSPGGRIYHETHYAPMLRVHGTVREIALDVVRADGSRIPVLVNAVLERDADARPHVVRIAVFDATARREYERELLRAKQRAEASEARARELAQTLQQTLIPPAPPQIAGLDIAASYRPAGDGSEVGGDFYDVFQIAAGDWVVAVGDVRGKGVGAAVVTALARHTLRAASVRHARPSEALAMLNDVLLHDDTDRFCTVAAVRLTASDGTWTAELSLGGHPLPLLVRPGQQPEPVGTPGTVLGVLAGAELTDEAVALDPGDMLLLYTDGVTEGRSGRELYGDDRLVESAARHAGAAQHLVDGVLADVLEYQGHVARDDIALVAVGVPGQRRR